MKLDMNVIKIPILLNYKFKIRVIIKGHIHIQGVKNPLPET